MSFSNSEYAIIWSRRSLIPYAIAIFTSSEAVALAPKSSVLAGGGAVIGGAPGIGSVGAIPLSGCGDCFELTRQRCLQRFEFHRLIQIRAFVPLNSLGLLQRNQAPEGHTDL